ncbi:uncharacterized protein LOC142168344 [Nicotiana tabacum]|uniref:Uncharacterized protein LOC142168344 n=1 Tax=Nicotiana tabacum TaxID=4097 RepID=A0AC58SJI7_TOBAC
MKLALRGKGKLGFEDGSCTKSRYRGIIYASDARKAWNDFQQRFDHSNLTKIYYLWSEIAMTRHGTDPVTIYYTKMKDLWDELDVLAPISCCDCEKSRPSVEHLKSQRVLQFLMGLN